LRSSLEKGFIQQARAQAIEQFSSKFSQRGGSLADLNQSLSNWDKSWKVDSFEPSSGNGLKAVTNTPNPYIQLTHDVVTEPMTMSQIILDGTLPDLSVHHLKSRDRIHPLGNSPVLGSRTIYRIGTYN